MWCFEVRSLIVNLVGARCIPGMRVWILRSGTQVKVP